MLRFAEVWEIVHLMPVLVCGLIIKFILRRLKRGWKSYNRADKVLGKYEMQKLKQS